MQQVYLRQRKASYINIYKPTHKEQSKKQIPFFLGHARMDANWREVALHKKLVQLSSSTYTLDEDDNLIEIQSVQQIIQLAILL